MSREHRMLVASILCFALAGLILILWSCGYPTSPPGTQREMMMAGFVLSRCKELGHPGVTTVFTDHIYVKDKKVAFAWAVPGDDHVTVYRPAVNDEEKYPDHILNAYAKHECCHISGIWNEDEAGACVRVNWP